MTLAAELEDRLAIIELTQRYCWALDSKQLELLDTVFMPGARAELRSAPLEGREAIRSRIHGALAPLDATQHTVTNHMITVGLKYRF